MRKSLAAALGACTLFGVAACSPLAQDVASPVSTPTDLATPQSVNAREVVPQILMDERFVHAWPDEPQGIARFANGGYLVSTRLTGEFVAIRAPLTDIPRDVVVSATFRKVGGPPGGGYGLIVRDQGASSGDGVDQTGRYVVAEVGDRGEAGVWLRDTDHWTDLVPWAPSSAVHTDVANNELTAHLLGNRLTFLANGTQIADLEIAPQAGAVGIFVGGDGNEVLIDRFRVQVPGRPVDLTAASSQPAAANARPAAAVASPPEPQPRPPAVTQPPRNPAPNDPSLSEAQRVRDLLTSLAEEVGALLSSVFSDGFDGPHSPVNDPTALRQAVSRFSEATNKAHEVLAELDRLQNGAADRGR